MPESESGARSPEQYHADAQYDVGEWKDWAKLEGHPIIEKRWAEYLAQYPEVSKMDKAAQDVRRERIAKECAREHGFNVSDEEKGRQDLAA